MIRHVVAMSAVAALAGGLAVAPATAAPKGKARVSVDEGCVVTLSKKGTKRTVRSDRTVSLPTGKYRVTTRPASCAVSRKTVRVRKGKTVKIAARGSGAQTLLVPTSYSGTLTGEEVGPTRTTKWTANVTVALEEPVGISPFAGFETLAFYRPTSFSGTYTVSGGVPGGCQYSGGGSIGLADLRADSTGKPEQWWSNPWNSFTYAFLAVSSSATRVNYTEECPEEPPRQTSSPAPFRWLATNAWEGTDPVPPLQAGTSPSGSFTWQLGTTTYTWTWDLNPDAAKRIAKPN